MPFWWSSKDKEDIARVNDILSESYACINQGLCYDEINDFDNTVAMYERGLNLIAEAEKEKCVKKTDLYESMMETKTSVQNRLKQMRKDGPRKPVGDQSGPTEKDVHVPLNKEKEVEALEFKAKEDIREKLDSVGHSEAELVYFLPGGVQLFIIEGEETAAPTYPTSLEILRLKPKTPDTPESFISETEAATEGFIQVGPWVYPLMGERSPVLKNEYGAYVVANPTPDHPNMMVAIMLPSDIEPKLVEEFEYVLKAYANFRTEEVKEKLTVEERKRLSEKIAQLLVKTGETIAWGVQTTSVKVASHLEERNNRYRAGLTPTDRPMNISPAVKSSVVYMHKGGKVVAKCTRYLLDKIGDMGISIGRSLSSSAKDTFGEGKTGGLVSGTITVLGGGIVSISTVWIAMEDASKNLCKSIANQTVENVKVKYGDEAAETTHHALYATGHSSLAAMQLWDLGPRSVAGRMARKAGLQVVSELHRKKTGAELIYGDRKKEKLPIKGAV